MPLVQFIADSYAWFTRWLFPASSRDLVPVSPKPLFVMPMHILPVLVRIIFTIQAIAFQAFNWTVSTMHRVLSLTLLTMDTMQVGIYKPFDPAKNPVYRPPWTVLLYTFIFLMTVYTFKYKGRRNSALH